MIRSVSYLRNLIRYENYVIETQLISAVDEGKGGVGCGVGGS